MARATAKKAGPSRKLAKVSVSLSEEDEAWVRARAEKEQRPLSAVLADIVTKARRDEAWREATTKELEKLLAEAEAAEADGQGAEHGNANVLAQPKRR